MKINLPKNDYEFINAIVFERARGLEFQQITDITLGRITRKDIRDEMAIVYSAWLDLIVCFDTVGKPDYFRNDLIDRLTDAFIDEVKSIYDGE